MISGALDLGGELVPCTAHRFETHEWAHGRLRRSTEVGEAIEPKGLLDWAAILALPDGRGYLADRWRLLTALPGDRLENLMMMRTAEVQRVHPDGRMDLVVVNRETLYRDPLALDRVWPSLPEGAPLFIRDESAPGGGRTMPFVMRDVDVRGWRRV